MLHRTTTTPTLENTDLDEFLPTHVRQTLLPVLWGAQQLMHELSRTPAQARPAALLVLRRLVLAVASLLLLPLILLLGELAPKALPLLLRDRVEIAKISDRSASLHLRLPAGQTLRLEIRMCGLGGLLCLERERRSRAAERKSRRRATGGWGVGRRRLGSGRRLRRRLPLRRCWRTGRLSAWGRIRQLGRGLVNGRRISGSTGLRRSGGLLLLLRLLFLLLR